MGELIFGIIVGIPIGMVVGWVFLPEPVGIREFFVRHGWAKPKV